MINQYVKNLCYYVILTTVVFNIFPDEKYVKYVKMFSGFILILIIIMPFTKIFDGNLDFNDIVNEFAVDVGGDNLQNDIEEYESIIENRIEESMTENANME